MHLQLHQMAWKMQFHSVELFQFQNPILNSAIKLIERMTWLILALIERCEEIRRAVAAAAATAQFPFDFNCYVNISLAHSMLVHFCILHLCL